MIEPALYEDEQAVVPGFFCVHCGCEEYPPTYQCLRCERRGDDDDHDGTE